MLTTGNVLTKCCTVHSSFLYIAHLVNQWQFDSSHTYPHTGHRYCTSVPETRLKYSNKFYGLLWKKLHKARQPEKLQVGAVHMGHLWETSWNGSNMFCNLSSDCFILLCIIHFNTNPWIHSLHSKYKGTTQYTNLLMLLFQLQYKYKGLLTCTSVWPIILLCM